MIVHIRILYLLVGVVLTLCFLNIGGLIGPKGKAGRDGHSPYKQHRATSNFLTAVKSSTIPPMISSAGSHSTRKENGVYVGLNTFTVHIPSITTTVTHFLIKNPSDDFKFLATYSGGGTFEFSLQESPWMTQADNKIQVTSKHPTTFKDAGGHVRILDFDLEILAYTLTEGYNMSGQYMASGSYI